MGIAGSPGAGRPHVTGRSIPATFTLTVTLPAAGLAVLWGLGLAAFCGVFSGHGFTWPRHPGLVTLTLATGGGLVVIAACVLLAGSFTRRLRRDILDLEAAARQLADEHLPQAVAGIRRGEPAEEVAHTPAPAPVKTAELALIGAAIADCQRTAVAAAAGETSLRNGLGQVFVSLARRNQSLLQRQLRLIDALEQKAPDPAALADLFPLDHLTTRMRRHAESLIILSGAAPGRSWSQPVPMIDVIRGAVAEVEDYTRVKVMTSAGDAVAGSAAADMIHLLAELIENATLFSPSSTQAEVRAERVANGFAVEVDDRGLGIKPDQIALINEQLARPPDFDLANADRLGLFVVGRLAARHGVKVSLRTSPYGGTSAIVLLPNSIVLPAPDLPSAGPAGGYQPAGSARLDLRGGPALALTARPPSPSSLTSPPLMDSPGAASAGPSAAEAGGGLGLSAPAPATPVGGQERPGEPVQPAGAGSHRGLPRRVRQASLSPHLRDNGAAEAPPDGGTPLSAPAPAPSAERSPQEARDLMSSLQSGWRRGREPDPEDDK
jgi:signal transduction histidine kinase